MNAVYSVIAQQLPPIQSQAGFDLVNFLINALAALLWSVVALIIFSLAVIVVVRMFAVLMPGIDQVEQIRNGNVAVALVMLGFMLAAASVLVAVLLK